MNIYSNKIKETLYETERTILELDRAFSIFGNNYQTLSKRLEKVHQTLKLINEDLQADAKAEDLYNTQRDEDKKIAYMEQNEIDRMKWGERPSDIDPNYEQAKNDIETIADDVLKASGYFEGGK